jgi:acetyl-CoA synthetase
MQRPLDELVEPASLEAPLSAYREACRLFNWEDEEKKLLTKEGRINIAVLCLEGAGGRTSSYTRAFDIVEAGGDEPVFSSVSAGELEERVRRLSTGLRRRLGVRPGEAVAVYLPNGMEQAVSILGLSYMGAIASPIIDIYRVEPLKNRLRDLKPRILITSPAMIEDLDVGDVGSLTTLVLTGKPGGGSRSGPPAAIPFDQLLGEPRGDPEFVAPDHPFMIHYTPGTLGQPKGVLHAHGAAAGYLHTARWVFRLEAGSTFWCTSHPGWILGSVYGILAPLLCGATSILAPADIDPGPLMSRLRPQAVYTVPSTLANMLTGGTRRMAAVDMSSVKVLASAGERLGTQLARDVRDACGVPVFDTWWMTETGMIMIGGSPSVPVKSGALGLPVPGVRAVVVDEKGTPLPPNALGLIAIEGTWPSMLKGIWGDEEASGRYVHESRFLSSDYAYCDEDGYFWFQGRSEDFIKRGGEKISPVEIEEVLSQHPAVEEAAVIGVTKEGRDRIIAYVVLAPGFEISEEVGGSVKDWIAGAMGSFARPDELRVIDALPKTRIGKVLKRELRAREAGAPSGGAPGRSNI